MIQSRYRLLKSIMDKSTTPVDLPTMNIIYVGVNVICLSSLISDHEFLFVTCSDK